MELNPLIEFDNRIKLNQTQSNGLHWIVILHPFTFETGYMMIT